MIAIARRQWGKARHYLSEALLITEANGDKESTAQCYQLLAGLEHEQGQWEEAERWLRKALALAEDMGQEIRVAVCHLQLGFTADARGHAAEALEHTVRALALARRFPQFANQQQPAEPVLSSVTRQLGIGAVTECWKRLTGEPLPDDVRKLALSNQNTDQNVGQDQDERQQSHDGREDEDQQSMTENTVRRAARAAARRLADELDSSVRTQVEDALEAHDGNVRPEQYFDPVSLGSLIVSTAALAWTIYKDRRAKKPKPAPQMIVKLVELALPPSDQVRPEQRAKIIEIVVQETLDNDP
jgi:tetratricopeptide (TPR) repeat protein